jgi:hypothetical protein
MNVDIKITLTDDRDGCTYERVYVQTPDWSVSCRELIETVLPGCWPDYAHAANRYGGGNATGIIRDDASNIVGRFDVVDEPVDKLPCLHCPLDVFHVDGTWRHLPQQELPFSHRPCPDVMRAEYRR